MLSCNVEERLARYQRPDDWSQADEAQAYETCLKEVLEEHGRAWADGNIRIGDYILLSEYLTFLTHSAHLTYPSRLRYPCPIRLPPRLRLRDGTIPQRRHHAILIGRHASRQHLL